MNYRVVLLQIVHAATAMQSIGCREDSKMRLMPDDFWRHVEPTADSTGHVVHVTGHCCPQCTHGS